MSRADGDRLVRFRCWPFVFPGAPPQTLTLFVNDQRIDALTLGEDTAKSLGFDLGRLRIKLVGGAALAVGSAVAVTGAIGFVGLVVPHLLRPLVGHRPGRLLLVSGLGGAARHANQQEARAWT